MRGEGEDAQQPMQSEENVVEEYSHHARLRRLRDHPRPQGRDGDARRHRPHRAHRHGFDHASLALPAQPRFRRGRDLGVVLHRGPRPGLAGSALPVFLHRRFRHGFVFINTGKGIKKPTDLIGRRIGIKSFLVTAIHWMRGILETRIRRAAHRGRMGRRARRGRRLHAAARPQDHAAAERQVGRDMLAEGELDALIHSSIIKPIAAGDPRVAPAVAGLQGGGDRVLQEDRHFPDHACDGHQARDRRAAIPGCRSTCTTPSRSRRRSPWSA